LGGRIPGMGLILLILLLLPAVSVGFAAEPLLTLEQTIKMAIKANLNLKISREKINQAYETHQGQRTHFLPTLSANYQANRRDDQQIIPGIGGFEQLTDYTFGVTFQQPLFTGMALISQYEITELGLDVAVLEEKISRQNITFQAQQLYFNLLKALKLVEVSQDTVEQIRAETQVADNYYQAGVTPLNDLLQAQVELANAEQELVTARNNLDVAVSNLNLLLRRPIQTPVTLEDILDYEGGRRSMDQCFEEALTHRLEIHVADLAVTIAEKEIRLSKKDYYPTLRLEGNYFRRGNDAFVDGGEGIADPDGWNIAAIASWNFWEWGRTRHGVNEKESKFSEKGLLREQVYDQVRFEVKQSYLKARETEKNITTIEKAIRQAEENYRITQEQYKEQAATSTDVLIARTLLSQTRTNYYTALYDFKISQAALNRAMGRSGP
jgi:outer membrane protein